MNYLNYFGSYQEQIEDMKRIESELLIRKVISLGILADILKEKDIYLYMSTLDRYGGIGLNVERKGYEDFYGLNDLSFLLLYPAKYGLENAFFDKYITLMTVAMDIDEKLKNEDIRKLGIPEKVNIDTSNDEWLRTIFRVIQKEELYSLLTTHLLSAELEVNSKKEKLFKV